jgi:hypothetical protein
MTYSGVGTMRSDVIGSRILSLDIGPGEGARYLLESKLDGLQVLEELMNVSIRSQEPKLHHLTNSQV